MRHPTIAAITHLLAYNDVPLHPEVLGIRDAIFQASLEQHWTSDLFCEIRETFERVLDDSQELEIFFRLHRSTFSPIGRLPGDILCEIFACVTNPVTGVGCVGNDSSDSPPWVLGLVCRTWRDHAISYQRLW
ncbi:hypothetical protein DFH06DRAFT_1023809, partial [Mycena polygramma]